MAHFNKEAQAAWYSVGETHFIYLGVGEAGLSLERGLCAGQLILQRFDSEVQIQHLG
jgi:hypothetical protein